MVLSALSHKVTNKFKVFCKTDLMDRFLYACIDYFTVFFELQARAPSLAAPRHAKPPHPTPRHATPRHPTPPHATPARSADAPAVRAPAAPQKLLNDASEEVAKTERLTAFTAGKASKPARPASSEQTAATMQAEEEAKAKLKDIANIYAAILVKHTNYANTQQERQFFETLYDFSARVLFTINDRKRWHAIENELGRVFRSEHFNLSMRKNEQQATKPLRCRELYEIKMRDETHGGPAKVAVNRKSSIHTAMAMRSPVISTIFPTPKEMMVQAAKDAADMQTAKALERAAQRAAAERADAAAGAPAFGNSMRELHEAPPASQSTHGAHTHRSSHHDESEGASARLRQQNLSSEEAIDAEIAQATDAFNTLVG